VLTEAVWRRRATAVIAVIFVPLAAAGIYAGFGNPGMQDRPRAERLQRSGIDETAALIGRVEKVLQQRPDDGRGWDLIAPVYLRVGQSGKAAQAYANAIRLLGSTPERHAGLGEALTLAARGIVTPEARDAFAHAVAADPNNARSRYFLARAKAQNGDRAGAAADMQAMLDAGPADAPWRSFVERALAEFQREVP
jgi:cytochrome c-type biogenesis protein CcmH